MQAINNDRPTAMRTNKSRLLDDLCVKQPPALEWLVPWGAACTL